MRRLPAALVALTAAATLALLASPASAAGGPRSFKTDRAGVFVHYVEIPISTSPGEHSMKAGCNGYGLGSFKIIIRGAGSTSPRGPSRPATPSWSAATSASRGRTSPSSSTAS
jgi:hypothetical protein